MTDFSTNSVDKVKFAFTNITIQIWKIPFSIKG